MCLCYHGIKYVQSDSVILDLHISKSMWRAAYHLKAAVSEMTGGISKGCVSAVHV